MTIQNGLQKVLTKVDKYLDDYHDYFIEMVNKYPKSVIADFSIISEQIEEESSLANRFF